MIVKLEIEVDLKGCFDSLNSEEVAWFRDNVLLGHLLPHSNKIGDEIGEVKVTKILTKEFK